ncbi:hypothetical protein KP509_33G015500 [Ceratopteris richardii]|uniref:Uncharacterized protein n=1 Tax=Ceratopteris richardii TaxID=49495 RepID=A0A8T2QMA7_CERRI|nr:hypothetical protein KP509_33G015500 [Ceratopteris richardii]
MHFQCKVLGIQCKVLGIQQVLYLQQSVPLLHVESRLESLRSSKSSVDALHTSFITLQAINFVSFIGAPFYEVKEYYREGTFDNCRSKWGDLFDCFHLKTLSEARSQELLQSREREKIQAHIWTFHTREEAATAWKRKYGQLDEEN